MVSFCPITLEINKKNGREKDLFNMAIVFMPPCGQSTQWIFVIYAAAAQNVKFSAILSFDCSDGENTVYSKSLQFYTFWNQTESEYILGKNMFLLSAKCTVFCAFALKLPEFVCKKSILVFKTPLFFIL